VDFLLWLGALDRRNDQIVSPSPLPKVRSHWPALDGWRGFTIWFAISVHAGYFTAGGVLSLDTFFVLSGFLITGLLLREWDRSEGIDLLSFWARRARRLLPALFVVLAAVLVYAAVLAPSLGLDKLRADVLASLGYVVNWHFILSGQSYFGSFTTPSPLLHLWSLAVEEQFYLIWPPIVLLTLWAARRRFSERGAIATVGLVALVGAMASSIWMVALYQPGADPSRVYYGTDTRAQAMLIGAALAVFSTLHGPLRSRGGRTALTVVAPLCLVIVVAPWFASDTTAVHDFFYGQYGLFVYCVATAVVLWRLTQDRVGIMGAALSLSAVRWVGGISYEMYLWHWPTYLVVTPDRTGLDGLTLLAVRLSVVVALAFATARLVDDPIRRGVRLHTPRLARLGAAAAVIVLSVGVFAATIGAEPALSGNVGDLADQSAAPTTQLPANIKVLMTGDSQGATIAQGIRSAPGLYGVSAQPGLTVWNRAILGCPIVSFPVFVIDGNQAKNKCGGAGYWQQQWASDVAQFRPDVAVVMAGAWDVFDALMPDGSVQRAGNREFDATYRRDVAQLIDTLSSTGAAVVVIKPPCFGANNMIGGDAQSPARLDKTLMAAVDAVWTKAAKEHGAKLLNLDPVLCPKGVSNESIRPDGAHFSGTGADQVAPRVARAAREALAAQRAAAPTPTTTTKGKGSVS
jgi:peptidoglycan/LPS O-acetylase OafA/YrhL/lysophospholipase L1-like esterase